MSNATLNRKIWVAFGPAGAVGSVQSDGDGFTVRMLADDRPRGTFPSLAIAQSALYSSLLPGSDWPEFREH